MSAVLVFQGGSAALRPQADADIPEVPGPGPPAGGGAGGRGTAATVPVTVQYEFWWPAAAQHGRVAAQLQEIKCIDCK